MTADADAEPPCPRVFAQRTVLIVGTGRPFERSTLQAARMAAATVCEIGLSLITGSSLGVDTEAARTFCAEVEARCESAPSRYRQFYYSRFRHREFWPGRAFRPSDPAAVVRISSPDVWLGRVCAAADAAIVLGGRGGTRTVVRRFIEAGKPVLPVPFTGGDSNELFQTVLRDWHEAPVPGLSKAQFLRLAIPWHSGTGALADLLLGTLSENADVFISYRRRDTDWVAGRLCRDLIDRFGEKRVFMDVSHLRPGDEWPQGLDRAIKNCRVGIVVVGPRWLEPPDNGELFGEKDVVGVEIERLLKLKKKVYVVTTADSPDVEDWKLPAAIKRVETFQALVVTDASWTTAIDQLARALEQDLKRTSAVTAQAHAAVAGLPAPPGPPR